MRVAGDFQGWLQRAGQKHSAAGHAVCLEQFVDGQKQAYAEGAGMSAPAIRAETHQRPEKAVD